MLPHQPNFFTNRFQVTPPSDLMFLGQLNGIPFVNFREMFRKNVLFGILWCVISVERESSSGLMVEI